MAGVALAPLPSLNIPAANAKHDPVFSLPKNIEPHVIFFYISELHVHFPSIKLLLGQIIDYGSFLFKSRF